MKLKRNVARLATTMVLFGITICHIGCSKDDSVSAELPPSESTDSPSTDVIILDKYEVDFGTVQAQTGKNQD